MATQPRLSATGNKTPELLEIRIGGGSIKAQLDYAKSLLGKEIKPPQVFRDGEIIDVVGVTKGKGIQGHRETGKRQGEGIQDLRQVGEGQVLGLTGVSGQRVVR